MIQRRNLLLGTASLALSSLARQPAQAAGFRPNLAGLEHRVTDASAPEVFFIPELSDAAMLRVYRIGSPRAGLESRSISKATANRTEKSIQI